MTKRMACLLEQTRTGPLSTTIAVAVAISIGANTSAGTADPREELGSPSPISAAGASPIVKAGEAVLSVGATGYAAQLEGGRGSSTISLGVADRETGRKVKANYEFQMGSNTKTMVAAVALQLVGEGTLGIDDNVEEWLPGVVPEGEAITVRMLLQHTSGLFDYASDQSVGEEIFSHPERQWTPDELVGVAVAHGPAFAPGTSWSYSNTGFVLVGMILQKATGTHVRDLIDERIVRPLNLGHTYWAVDSRFRDERHLHGYYRTQPDGSEYVDVTANPVFRADAAGSMVSNLENLTRFAQAFQDGTLLDPTELGLMRTMVDIPGQERVAAYELGLIRFTTEHGAVWGHTGGPIEYLSQVWASSDGRRSFVQVVPTGAATPAGPDSAIDAAAFAAVMTGWMAMGATR